MREKRETEKLDSYEIIPIFVVRYIKSKIVQQLRKKILEYFIFFYDSQKKVVVYFLFSAMSSQTAAADTPILTFFFVDGQ